MYTAKSDTMPFEGRAVRWGIVGCGNISRDFVSASLALDAQESQVVACAARQPGSAEAFAANFKTTSGAGGMRSYVGYESLFADNEVDVVYIGTLANTHEELILQALAAGKHVLVEKPMTLNAEGARRVVAAAKEKGLFFMEGMWTRFFPAVRKVREVLASGAIGDVVTIGADFGWPAVADPKGPHARLFDPASGGVCLDIACYPLAHVLLGCGGAKPARVRALGVTAGDADSSADWSVSAALSGFPPPADRSLVASIMITLRANTPEEVVFTGTKGYVRIHRSAHTPTKITVGIFQNREDPPLEEVFEFPLPPTPPGAMPWIYPGSQGFVYEAQAVVRALRAGLTQCDEYTRTDSVTVVELVECMREQVLEGHVPPPKARKCEQ